MYVAFIDDSVQHDPPRPGIGRLVAMGGVVVEAGMLTEAAACIQSTRSSLGIPDGEELKWKPPKGSFLARNRETLTALRQRLLDDADRCGMKSIVVMIDHSAAYRNETVVDLGHTLLGWFFERFSHCIRANDDIGMIIADKPGGSHREDHRWLAQTLELTEQGTEYVTPDHIALPVLTAPSHHVPLLQLADLVVAATTAAVAGIPAGQALARDLSRLMYRRESAGHLVASGCGLAMFPRERLGNLLHHVFGEEHASTRDADAPVVQLPHPDWRFADGGGLPTREAPQLLSSDRRGGT